MVAIQNVHLYKKKLAESTKLLHIFNMKWHLSMDTLLSFAFQSYKRIEKKLKRSREGSEND